MTRPTDDGERSTSGEVSYTGSYDVLSSEDLKPEQRDLIADDDLEVRAQQCTLCSGPPPLHDRFLAQAAHSDRAWAFAGNWSLCGDCLSAIEDKDELVVLGRMRREDRAADHATELARALVRGLE